jgi:hypothetical protein
LIFISIAAKSSFDIYTYQLTISQEYLQHPLLLQTPHFTQPLLSAFILSLVLPLQLLATLSPPIFVSFARFGYCCWPLASFATLLREP